MSCKTAKDGTIIIDPENKDKVDLVFVTPHNFLYAYAVDRPFASELIRGWFDMREKVRQKRWGWRRARKWLQGATFAFNLIGMDGTVYSTWAIGWENVIGMYIKEREQTAYERLVNAQEKLATAVTKEMNNGNEWKGEGE